MLIITSFGTLQIHESFSEEPSTWNIGKIKWYEQNFHFKIPSYLIQAVDHDMNSNPDKIDKFNIKIWSDSDPVGIIISVYETEKNSGVFGSTVFISEDVSTGQRLHAYSGDAITAEYEDNTLPSTYLPDEKIRISDTVIFPGNQVNLDEYQNSSMRIDDDAFTKQHLLTGKPMVNPAEFRESGGSIGLLYAYSGLGLVGVVLGFFVIKKWKIRK